MFCTVLIRLVFYAPVMGVGGILRAAAKSSNMPGMVSTIAVSILIMLVLIGVLMAIVMPRFKRAQKLLDHLNLVARERLSGLMVIRAFNTEAHEEKRFDEANRKMCIRDSCSTMPKLRRRSAFLILLMSMPS